jgi:DNA-binding beta-propeller fold protein YncE
MSFRRVAGVAAMALATWLELSCGQVYRPVVIPISITPPNPANFHAVFGISANVPFNPGTALQIDVSGDSNIGVANMGVNPTHAAILPNNSRVFVASAGSMFAGNTDVITAFFPAGDSSTAGGLGTTTTFTLPGTGAGQSSSIAAISESSNLVTVTLSAPLSNALVGAVIDISSVGVSGYNGIFPISFVNGTTIQYVDSTTGLAASSGGIATVPVSCSYLPDFVATTQTNAVFVANYGVENGLNCNFSSTDSVAALNPSQGTIGNIAYLPAGSHPVAMVETPNALNLYVLNQGNNTVSDLSPQDLSTLATIPVGNTPAWAVVRPDNQRVYVVTQGDGQLYTIRTDTNAAGSPQSVGGAGANFVLYDKTLNRLYVTNPNAGAVYVFDATTDPPTPMGSATGAISIPAPAIPANTAPCSGGACSYSSVMPVSVAALPDGTRFYVASYVTAAAGSSCPDPNVAAAGCVIPQVTVFDAGTLTVRTTVFPLLPPGALPVGGVQPFALAPAVFCAPVIPYTPASSRFRMSAVAAVDSSRVYASMCDGGSVAIVAATTNTIATGVNAADTLVTDLPAPFSAATAPPSGEPPPQNPVFLLTGQ